MPVHLKPISSNWSCSVCNTPASVGVTLGHEISDWVSFTGSMLDADIFFYSLNRSLIEVLDRVWASTVLTITAQYNPGFDGSLFGRLPGTITE